MLIRSATESDYEAIAAVFNAAYTDASGARVLSSNADELREADLDRPSHVRAGRRVAELDGQVVAGAEWSQLAYRHHPRKFWIDLFVHPDCRGQGLGAALWQELQTALTPFDPLALQIDLREDLQVGLGFLQRRGFSEASRVYESILTLADFDPRPFQDVIENLAQQGVTIKTLPDLEDDPNRDRKLYELVWEYRQDMPDLIEAQKETFEFWLRNTLESPNMIPEAFFVAVRGDEYIGMSYYHGNQPVAGRLRLAQTGVARTWRRRGIALALRLYGVDYARRAGYTTIRTVNEGRNAAMLYLNDLMGFHRLPAWIVMEKRLATE